MSFRIILNFIDKFSIRKYRIVSEHIARVCDCDTPDLSYLSQTAQTNSTSNTNVVYDVIHADTSVGLGYWWIQNGNSRCKVM